MFPNRSTVTVQPTSVHHVTKIAHLLVVVGQRQPTQPAGLAGPLARAHDGGPEPAGVDSYRGRGVAMRPIMPEFR